MRHVWLIGDNLAFTVSFLRATIVAIMSGKFLGGVSGALLARWLSVPKAIELGEQDFFEQAKAGDVNLGALSGTVS